ncbi:head-tail connector protein [Kaistia sp. MMO-174]|uniref:head-tail connector protein n=1 Tax=Kaistia sp. MMO-174 TaxID=3081256 RepID=UPI003019E0F2
MINAVVVQLGPLFTLAEVKEHLRVDSDDEDAVIEGYMDAAVMALLAHCNAAFVPPGKEAIFKVAGLQTVAFMYEPEGREGRGEGLPPSAQRLINPFRNLRV